MKKLYRIAGVILSILLCISFAACSGSKTQESSALPANEYPLTVGGLTVKAPPQRVAVFSENLADVILACCLETALVARGESCTQSELASLPVISASNVDAIKALEPDLVLFDTQPENFEELALKGVRVMVIEGAKSRAGLEKLYADVASVFRGKTTGTEEGTQRAQELLASLDDITRKLPATSVLCTACYLTDLEGGTADSDSFISVLLEAAGLANCFQNSTDTSLGALKIASPDYIFCPTGLAAAIHASPDFAELAAVRRDCVYELDPSLLARQGTSLLDAANAIVDMVYNGSNPPGSQPPAPSQPSSSSEPSESSASESSETEFEELKNGDSGERVLALQMRLIELGYLTVDDPSGDFGDLTEAAVTSFQYYNDYYATGIVNEATYKAIFSDDAIPYPDEDD